MKRVFVIAGAVGGVLVAVIVVAAVILYSSLDSLIETGVEDVGSDATLATVSLKAAKVSPTSGEGSLSDLYVGNPKGFETESAFRLGEVSVKFDVATLADDVIIIEEVVIVAPEVTYELGPDGSNIDAIERNVEAYVNALTGTSGGSETPAGADGSGPKLIIENLYIRDGVVNVSMTVLAGKTLSAPLPDIHLTDIGREEGGASPGNVIEEVLASVGDGISSAIAPLDLGAITGAIGEGAEGVGEVLTEGAEDATGAIAEGVEGVGESFKNLLGN